MKGGWLTITKYFATRMDLFPTLEYVTNLAIAILRHFEFFDAALRSCAEREAVRKQAEKMLEHLESPMELATS
jgi:hypothetical protein